MGRLLIFIEQFGEFVNPEQEKGDRRLAEAVRKMLDKFPATGGRSAGEAGSAAETG